MNSTTSDWVLAIIFVFVCGILIGGVTGAGYARIADNNVACVESLSNATAQDSLRIFHDRPHCLDWVRHVPPLKGK